ncbi:MAG: hypothetical protein Q8906_14270 [Bacillota bacterium]|nr:hypothetical protein [Bacillota bacterium]MDP4171773.1 hypothetical protein [Bacillota bacterium]
MLPQSMGSETNIKLPFSFIIFSTVALVASQILLLFKGVMIAEGIFRTPAVWSAAHLLILGWALMTAMGAMYQLVPVAFLTPIWSEKLGYFQFFISSVGISLFAACLYFYPQYALFPGLVTLGGIVLFLIQMFMTLKKQAKPNVLTLFVGTALFCLMFTIILGIMMAYFLSAGTSSVHYQAFFQSHLLLGIAGWFTLLIFGFSYKMIPMFSLSHGYSMAPAKYVFGIYTAGLALSLASFFTGNTLLLEIGFFLLFAGFLLFAVHTRSILKKRIKKKLDKPFTFTIIAIGFGTLIHLAAFLAMVLHSTRLGGSLIYAYLLLWVALSIFGYLYKIVPFLWWTHKYSKEIGKKSVPSLKEMMNERVVIPIFSIFIISTLMVFSSTVFNLSLLFTIGQCLLSLAMIWFSISLLSVIKK